MRESFTFNTVGLLIVRRNRHPKLKLHASNCESDVLILRNPKSIATVNCGDDAMLPETYKIIIFNNHFELN